MEYNENCQPNQGSNTTTFSVTFLSSITEAPIEWLSWPRIPCGMQTLIGAPGGVGKGLVGVNIAAAVTHGLKHPFEPLNPIPQGRVLWIEEEDPIAEVVKPRFQAAGADMSRVIIERGEWFARMKGDAAKLRRFLTKFDIRLIVMSPLLQALGIDNLNCNKEVFAALRMLQDAIEGSRVASLGIVHCNKGEGLGAIQRILGSVAFTNFVRSVLLITTDEDDRRRLVHGKHNCSSKADDMIFKGVSRHRGTPEECERSQAYAIEWSTADDNVDVGAVFDRKPDKGKKTTAGVWLRDYLKKVGGMALLSDILAAAEGIHSYEALERARTRDKIATSTKVKGGGVVWQAI